MEYTIDCPPALREHRRWDARACRQGGREIPGIVNGCAGWRAIREVSMLKRLFLPCLAVLAVLAMGFGAAEAKSLDDIIKAGVIRIGINPNFPPMSSRGSDGNWQGFDIDVGNKIADTLGVKVEWVPTETPQRVPFLVADKIDISLGALTRTAERAKLIEFTVPLHTEVMAVLTTDKVTVDDWKQLNDPKFTLADMRGNWTVDWLKQNLPNAKVGLTDTIADTVRMVAQGRADAIVENIDFFMAQTKNYPDIKWKVLPKTIDVSYDSIGVQRGNYPLRDALNIVLYTLHSTDFINDTWTKWYGAPMLVKVVPSPYF